MTVTGPSAGDARAGSGPEGIVGRKMGARSVWIAVRTPQLRPGLAGRRAGGNWAWLPTPLASHTPPLVALCQQATTAHHTSPSLCPLTTISIHQRYPELPRVHSRNDSSSKARLAKRSLCSATPLIACRMPYLAGDKGWWEAYAGNAKPFFLLFSASPDISSRQTVHPATPLHARPPASNKSPSHIGALTLHSPRGLGILIRPRSMALPLPFPVPRISLERSLTGTQILRTMSPFLHWHHGSSCFFFRIFYGSKR